jgi:hypothetical protein
MAWHWLGMVWAWNGIGMCLVGHGLPWAWAVLGMVWAGNGLGCASSGLGIFWSVLGLLWSCSGLGSCWAWPWHKLGCKCTHLFMGLAGDLMGCTGPELSIR